MPFKDVPSKVDFPAQERELLQWWKENQSFQKLWAKQKGRTEMPGLRYKKYLIIYTIYLVGINDFGLIVLNI